MLLSEDTRCKLGLSDLSCDDLELLDLSWLSVCGNTKSAEKGTMQHVHIGSLKNIFIKTVLSLVCKTL